MSDRERAAMRAALGHVFWLGGSVCAGKTSITEALARAYGLHAYSSDRHEVAHIARSDPERHPTLHTAAARTMDERWLDPSPEEMAATSTQFHRERFDLIVEDLLALPRDRPILAEGYGLLPECVVSDLADPRHALWLISRPAFLAAMREKRGMTAPALTSDPMRARANLIARDVLMAAALREDVTRRGLAFVDVDVSRDMAEMAGLVARHFGLA